tara:strand:+ start:763 stop:951 length:189 start_codon:yes stop_codon:yes gene_type:complete
MIKSVDSKKGTISLPGAEGKPDRVFTLSKEAKLTLDGKKQTSRISKLICGLEAVPNAYHQNP